LNIKTLSSTTSLWSCCCHVCAD